MVNVGSLVVLLVLAALVLLSTSFGVEAQRTSSPAIRDAIHGSVGSAVRCAGALTARSE
jgi:hypothetical protein